MAVSYKDMAQSQQQEQPVNRSYIRWNAEQHSIVIRGMLVALTPTEYRLLAPLQYGKPVTYADLAQQAYNCTLDIKMRKMMDKHIDRIRGKLQGTGTYVYCILNYGYVLLDEIFPDEGV